MLLTVHGSVLTKGKPLKSDCIIMCEWSDSQPRQAQISPSLCQLISLQCGFGLAVTGVSF